MYAAAFTIPLVLIALAIGYLVLIRAGKEETGVKDIGKVIGWLIIVIAFVSLVISIYSSFRYSLFSYDKCWKNSMMHGMYQKGNQSGMMMRNIAPGQNNTPMQQHNMMQQQTGPKSQK